MLVVAYFLNQERRNHIAVAYLEHKSWIKILDVKSLSTATYQLIFTPLSIHWQHARVEEADKWAHTGNLANIHDPQILSLYLYLFFRCIVQGVLRWDLRVEGSTLPSCVEVSTCVLQLRVGVL